MAKSKRKPQQRNQSPARRAQAVQAQRRPRVPQVQAVIETMAFHEGPLPTPETLSQYERVHPGLAERIIRTVELPMEMAKDQQEHRHALEQKVIVSDIRRSWAGLVAGFILTLVAIGGGVLLVLEDKPVAGLASIIMALGALVGVFVATDRRRAAERQGKDPNRRAS